MRTCLPERIVSIVVVTAAAGVIYLYAIRTFLTNLPDVVIPTGYDGVMFFVMQAMVLLSLVGSLRAYGRHRNIFPLLVAIVSAAAIIYGINAQLDTYYMIPGMLGLLVVSLWSSFDASRAEDVVR
ncbi:MAG: hypothetical protein ABI791_06665 [Acidobacteriota bacterium]